MRPRLASLVGMSQSARKRAARRQAWGWAQGLQTPCHRRHAARAWAAIARHHDPRELIGYALARWAYRVGERLRPCCCLGCVYGYWPCSGVRPARGAR